MEKKSNLSNAKSNMENIKSNGPSADDLKKRFKEGSIPLQTDFADLINIADMGRRAVGKAPSQTDNPNSALKLDNDGALAVKLNDNSGLKTDKDGLSVKIKNKSLLADNSGLAVNAGRGLRINNDKLEVDDHHGIEIVNEGVKVKASNGINVNSDGVSVKAKDKTINVESTGISVRLGWGIKIGDGLDVKASNGINVDSNGVSVKAGDGIKVDNNGVSIDPNKVLPKGMIVMFSGSSAPTGWAFCDGKTYNGVTVPDLRSRFVMCGETISDTGKSSNKASGGSSAKNFFRDTKPTTVSVSVNVQNTTLTEAQIPSHKHIGGMPYCWGTGMKYIGFSDTQTQYQIDNTYNSSIWRKHSDGQSLYACTSNTGGGQGHNHHATASSPSHNHSVDVIPPYYLLAFIMKL